MADDDDERGPRSPWSRATTMASGVFLLLLVAAGLVIVIVKPGGGQGHTATQQQVVTTVGGSNPSTTAKTESTGCSLPSGSQSVPSGSPPDGTSWGQIGGMSVPQAPDSLGPQRTANGWSTCFAHSPSGALLAAWNFWAEGTAKPSGQVYSHLAINVPKAALATKTNENETAGGSVQIVGYLYQSYSAHEAKINLVLQGPQGILEAVSTPMVWVDADSDWRYEFPPNGVPATLRLQGTSVSSPYVSWSAF